MRYNCIADVYAEALDRYFWREQGMNYAPMCDYWARIAWYHSQGAHHDAK